ncbi:pentatricopeptide repeat-containing protein 2, mitochondrial isoform X1 [Thamnophis elegans]|uniref:pentatricopeptide repeat-containing protein 2, mitochondrial isoform X1 n=1 Tax=Thamnophis elegans TaxID=35005 RepID=UPI0013784D9B|nr:pentatricopeptide repeat-containing protein 2, mitochondrial isoform X1 [Thamnophis elegans]
MAALVVRTSGRLLRKTAEYPAAGGLVADRVGCWNCFQGAKRYLLTEDVLQLRKFQEKKLENEYKIYGQKDAFFKTVEKKLANNALILKPELINVLYLCQSKNEIELVKRTIYRYHEENSNRAFGEFRFGPIFMRLCYELDLEAVALELIKDQTLNGFFGDYTSFNILMDMLFEKGHYEDALNVLLKMDRENIRFNQDTYLLAFAICYKLNSPEAWTVVNTLLEDKHLHGHELSRRTQYFIVALGLKQNDFLKAQYYFSQLQPTESIVYDNLKILLLAAFGNLKNLVETLEKASKIDTYFVRKPNFCKDVIISAREKLELNPDFIIQFEEIVNKLKVSGQINELTLDDLLCEVPHPKGYKMQLLKETKRSQRTLQPLQSFLLTD